MKFLMVMALALPMLAQEKMALPAGTMNIAGMVTPALPGRFEAGLRQAQSETPVAGKTLYRWSLASVLAANAADVASSWNYHEANPVLGGSGAQFGTTSIAIKSGFVAGSLLIQHVALRHRPDLYKKMAWFNFGTAGALGGVAKYNLSVR